MPLILAQRRPARMLPSVFVLGGETAGIGDTVRRHVTDWISIPMAGEVESLNVAAAAAVLCFELLRRAHGGSS